jgi:hypothetical protein
VLAFNLARVLANILARVLAFNLAQVLANILAGVLAFNLAPVLANILARVVALPLGAFGCFANVKCTDSSTPAAACHRYPAMNDYWAGKAARALPHSNGVGPLDYWAGKLIGKDTNMQGGRQGVPLWLGRAFSKPKLIGFELQKIWQTRDRTGNAMVTLNYIGPVVF